MYASFFGLRQEPFSIAPDPRYLYMSERHREALAHLLYGVGGGGGFVLLTGEIGAGKTTVCRCFLEQIPPRCNVAYIFNPKLTVPELLHAVCEEFRIPLPPAGAGAASVKDYVDRLNEFLLRTHAVGQNNVLIIDEAQNLSADVLEQLRLLTNLETNERKLLQIVLIGQPELRDMLARPELEQLAQRVIARFHLQALSEAETAQYIQHRLAIAGLATATPFHSALMPRIHQLTRGVPRRVNLLCDRALLGAYAGGHVQVSRAIVDQAAREVFGEAPAAKRAQGAAAAPPMWWLGAGLAGAALFGLANWAWQGGSAASTWRTGAAAVRAPVAGSAPSGVAAAASATFAASAASGVPVLSGAAAAVPAASGVPVDRVAAAAPQRGASAPVGDATPFDLVARFDSLPRSPRAGWQVLSGLWGLPDNEDDPCAAAARSRVLCDSHGNSLAMIRLLARPGMLMLHDARGRTAYAVLVGLGSDTATLRVDGKDLRVPLSVLAGFWRGEYLTLWRTPPGYGRQRQDSVAGPVAGWLAMQLQALQSPGTVARGASAADAGADVSASGAPVSAAVLKARVYAFQASQGLPPDGYAGPFTLMQLNRALGVDEPRLITTP